MITKKQLADLAIINLSGGMPIDSIKYSRDEMYLYVGLGVNAMINRELASKGRAWAANGSWIKPFPDVLIQWDENRQVCFFDLPASIVDIEDDLGLYSICPMEDESTQHVIGKKGSFAVFSQLEATYLGPGVFECYLEGSRVIFPVMPENYVDTPLLVSLIPDASGMDANDPINCPGILQDKLVELIADMARGQVSFKNKQINDQNADT